MLVERGSAVRRRAVIVLVLGAVLVLAAAGAVVSARWALGLDAVRGFLDRYPGAYPLPAGAPVGFPAWLAWQHFFNAFLMVLIIRSGLQVRREKRPRVFWSPRGRPKRRTSLTIWFHQALDVVWVVNGVAFVILLFATGQWMRIVPTSWDVLPNAASAVLQYVSLDWPTENGWVNYNSLQQLAYATTVFVAAPLAVATGLRLSTLWPRGDARLNRLFPWESARRLHVLVMLFFVVFIVTHVALVLATGALRNLNHMYAAEGSADPAAFADNWAGFWLFVLSLGVIVGACAAARPAVLVPVAQLFGTTTSR
ncbi:cytochrome b/b6 domain-containing protein [Microbacterium sp. 2P01SA-2]|uniref:cytochrome b/b6 domain-containing protein n=1 Tax=unclassified Microbacterium TaxID=2609290 RepID=UPI00399EF8C4